MALFIVTFVTSLSVRLVMAISVRDYHRTARRRIPLPVAIGRVLTTFPPVVIACFRARRAEIFTKGIRLRRNGV